MMKEKNKTNATEETFAEVFWKTETPPTNLATKTMYLIKKHLTWTTTDETPISEARNDISNGENGINTKKITQKNLSHFQGIGKKLKGIIIKKLKEMEIDIPEK